MKTYVIKIKPLTGFGSYIKGDTLFGHICWQIIYDPHILGKTFSEFLVDYESNPFSIVSSAYPVVDGKIYLKRPALPLNFLFSLSDEEIVSKRKELKKRNYFPFENPLKPLVEIDYQSLSFIKEDIQTRCTINRLTGTTGEAPFTPYSVDKLYFNCNLAIFVGLREDVEIEKFIEIISRIGKIGYGKDATVGYGKFEVIEYEYIDVMKTTEKPNAVYTLSPSVPDKEEVKKIYYTPFVRFGRHGSYLARSSNPFKNPVIFADEGAIIIPKKFPEKPYIGKTIKGLSKSVPETVCQGYSLILPVEVSNEL